MINKVMINVLQCIITTVLLQAGNSNVMKNFHFIQNHLGIAEVQCKIVSCGLRICKISGFVKNKLTIMLISIRLTLIRRSETSRSHLELINMYHMRAMLEQRRSTITNAEPQFMKVMLQIQREDNPLFSWAEVKYLLLPFIEAIRSNTFLVIYLSDEYSMNKK